MWRSKISIIFHPWNNNKCSLKLKIWQIQKKCQIACDFLVYGTCQPISGDLRAYSNCLKTRKFISKWTKSIIISNPESNFAWKLFWKTMFKASNFRIFSLKHQFLPLIHYRKRIAKFFQRCRKSLCTSWSQKFGTIVKVSRPWIQPFCYHLQERQFEFLEKWYEAQFVC